MECSFRDVLIENQTGREFTSKDENYYIAGYNYTTEASIGLAITSGTFGGQSIAGRHVLFENFDLQYNNINKVTVTFKKQSQNYQFALQAGSQTQIAATGGQATGNYNKYPEQCQPTMGGRKFVNHGTYRK